MNILSNEDFIIDIIDFFEFNNEDYMGTDGLC